MEIFDNVNQPINQRKFLPEARKLLDTFYRENSAGEPLSPSQAWKQYSKSQIYAILELAEIGASHGGLPDDWEGVLSDEEMAELQIEARATKLKIPEPSDVRPPTVAELFIGRILKAMREAPTAFGFYESEFRDSASEADFDEIHDLFHAKGWVVALNHSEKFLSISIERPVATGKS